ncbi:hypothetical protein STAS_20348 [Striga asiatica]|uniref:Uncharacterized protein n=1 Tax=Striga asiatica TaxID=4170 RepID=A0A5A7QEX9_STRAF|nr:hypothetical protein STAS_20348 [Striga asiatica]
MSAIKSNSNPPEKRAQRRTRKPLHSPNNHHAPPHPLPPPPPPPPQKRLHLLCSPAGGSHPLPRELVTPEIHFPAQNAVLRPPTWRRSAAVSGRLRPPVDVDIIGADWVPRIVHAA